MEPINRVAQMLYDAFAPVAQADAGRGYPLLKYINAIAYMFEEVVEIALDTDEGPGWSPLMDPDRIKFDHIGYLAQFLGERIPASLDENFARIRVRDTPRLWRGTPKAIQDAVRATLIGDQVVYHTERDTGSAWHYDITTYTSQTPSPDATERAIKAQKPAGQIYSFNLTNGGDFNVLRLEHDDFQDVKDTFATFADVRADPSLT